MHEHVCLQALTAISCCTFKSVSCASYIHEAAVKSVRPLGTWWSPGAGRGDEEWEGKGRGREGEGGGDSPHASISKLTVVLTACHSIGWRMSMLSCQKDCLHRGRYWVAYRGVVKLFIFKFIV